MAKSITKAIKSTTPNKDVPKNLFFVFRNGRKLMLKMFKDGFTSYEAARNVARIWLRSSTGQRSFSAWTPEAGAFKLSIKHVA